MTDPKHGAPGKHTLVEAETEIKGTLSSKCPLVVMGRVEGDVSGPSIHITTSGVVAGNVKVQELRCEGELAGDIQADTVRISGRVRDKTVVRAKSLEVAVKAEGGLEVIFGECELAIGDEPSKQAAIDAALASNAPKPAAPPAPTPPPKAVPPPPPKPSEPKAAAAGEIKSDAKPEDKARKRETTQPPPV